MSPAELRDYCLSLPEAEETFPFGPTTSVFKVAGKMFASPNSAPSRFGSASSANPSSPRRCAPRTPRCFPDTTSTSVTGTL